MYYYLDCSVRYTRNANCILIMLQIKFNKNLFY